MFLKKMLRAILATFEPKRAPGIYMGHARTCDISFGYRMGAGFPGDVNRTHPASIEACLVDVNAPPTLYGQAVVVDATTQGVRPLVAGDSALNDIYGITVRPFPIQQQAATNYGASNIGAGTPPTSQPMDVLRSGHHGNSFRFDCSGQGWRRVRLGCSIDGVAYPGQLRSSGNGRQHDPTGSQDDVQRSS